MQDICLEVLNASIYGTRHSTYTRYLFHVTDIVAVGTIFNVSSMTLRGPDLPTAGRHGMFEQQIYKCSKIYECIMFIRNGGSGENGGKNKDYVLSLVELSKIMVFHVFHVKPRY